MPILNAIDHKKALHLINYKLNAANAMALAGTFEQLIPDRLNKLILIENSLNDPSIAYMFKKLRSNPNGTL